MKAVSFLLLLSFFSKIVLAGGPQLPADLTNMNDDERKQAGAFFLFYSLAARGMIGGKSGVCVNYKPGDNSGSPDQISLGFDSKSYKPGKNGLSEAQKLQLTNQLGPLMGQVKTYLDGTCTKTPDECKKERSLSVDGYADALPYVSGSKNLETSITKNEELADRRAGDYLDVIGKSGFADFADPSKMTHKGYASPIGEYLREGVTDIPAKYNPTGAKYTASDYKVDCPERRMTVINIGYNGAPVDVTAKEGVVSPQIQAASKNFVKLSNMASSIQTLKAMKELGVTDFTLADAESGGQKADKIIEKIMAGNGITDPATIAACKNYSTRVMIKEVFDRYKGMTSTQQTDIMSKIGSKSEKEILQNLKLTRSDAGYADNQSLIALYGKTPDGLINPSKYPLLSSAGTNTGISTSPSDCFSAKNSLQQELSGDANLRSKLCKPGKDFFKKGSKEVHVNYTPNIPATNPSLHIGCQACKTGLRYVGDPNHPGNLIPTYMDREIGSSQPNNPALNNYKPITSTEIDTFKPKAENVKAYAEKYKECKDTRVAEIDSQITELKKVPSKNRDNAKIAALTKDKKVLNDGEKFFDRYTNALNFSAASNQLNFNYTLDATQPRVNFDNFEDPQMKDFLGKITTIPAGSCGKKDKETKKNDMVLSMDDVTGAHKVTTTYYNSPLGAHEKSYIKAKLDLPGNGGQKAIDYYEKVLVPNVQARNQLSNWDGTHADPTKANNFTFGGMKKPTYYVIPNCDCNDTNLIENAMKNGIAKVLDPVPDDKTETVDDAQAACVFTPPVPSSCMYDPNEAGAGGNDMKKEDEKIQWMGIDGNLVTSYLADLSKFMSDNNAKFQLQDCQDLTPQEVAQKVVDSVMCEGDRRLPQGDPIDCKIK